MPTDTPDSAPAAPQRTIVLVHGLWLTPLSWEGWQQRFESRGHKVLAPAWPGLEGSVEEVRANPKRYERLGVKEITDHYDRIIRQLDSPPIIIGHSFGGLVTQLLLDRGLGAAGVAVHPAPIKGVLGLPYSQLKVAWVALKNPANNSRAIMLTPEQFHFGFTNTLSAEESKPVYDRLAVPGPGRPLFQAGLANFNPNAVTKVNRHNSSRAPLLMLAGDKDHTVPASTVRASYKIQEKSGAPTELKEFPGRSHYTVGQDGWEEVADYVLDWSVRNAALRG
jgi:pimeloyl-ACP methyl ester carboxylesterase